MPLHTVTIVLTIEAPRTEEAVRRAGNKLMRPLNDWFHEEPSDLQAFTFGMSVMSNMPRVTKED